MTSVQQLCKRILCLSGVVVALTAPSFADGLSATATYTGKADAATPGLYDYSLTLNNTGTTTIGTFWFAWVPGGDFLAPVPTGATAPTGWTDSILTNPATGGTSIRYLAGSNLLQAGQSLSGFDFSTTETPAELLGTFPTGIGAGDAVTTAFVYEGAPFADPGHQLVATAATPEPGSLALLSTGLIGGATGLYRRFKSTRLS